MKILHIPQGGIGKKDLVSGIKTVLLEQVEWENKIENIESRIYINDKIEYDNEFFINDRKTENNLEDILKFSPDIVIFEGFYDIRNYNISKFLLEKKIKYFIKPHGSVDKKAQKNGLLKTIKKVLGNILIFNKFVEKSEGLIYLNENEKINSIYKKSSIIIPNGINKKYENENIKIIESNKINVIFIGKFDFHKKGIDRVLKIIKENIEYFVKNNIIFNFYGNGIKKDEKKMYEFSLRYKETIKIFGPVFDNEKKKKIIEEQDIFILLSRYEGMPMAILESLELAIPCFVSEGTEMGDIIEENEAGWLVRNNENIFTKFKTAVEEYKKNKYKYKKNAHTLSKKFLWENLLGEYKKMYNKVYGEIKNEK